MFPFCLFLQCRSLIQTTLRPLTALSSRRQRLLGPKGSVPRRWKLQWWQVLKRWNKRYDFNTLSYGNWTETFIDWEQVKGWEKAICLFWYWHLGGVGFLFIIATNDWQVVQEVFVDSRPTKATWSIGDHSYAICHSKILRGLYHQNQDVLCSRVHRGSLW